ncbi:MAG: glycosyltransferase family 4 protein [Oscillospiraceae bacterium]|nr:glycosyltransferase family 4 protein [Oscillospiraceae bacterium]
MIRVLNVISDSNIGGAGRVLLNYLQYADRDRFETMIAVPRGSLLCEPLRELGGVVYEVDGLAERSYHKDDVRTLMELIRGVNPDIVHTHGALSGRIAGRRCGKAVIYTRHSAFPVPAKFKYPPGRWVNKLVNEHYADHIIAVSPATAQNLTDAGISEEKITVMMNGVAPLTRASDEECAALRAELGLPPDVFTAGILARIEPYKGHLYILEAAERLKREGRGFRVLIAGTGSFEDEVRRVITEKKLEQEVLFLGFRSDVAKLLSILDVQLNASYGTEASSIALCEGLSLGVPAIASDYGGNPWQIDDGEDGLIFPSRDSAALARALTRLMDEPETLSRMQKRAVEIFNERFTGEIFARNVERVYLKTLEETNHGK